MKAIEMLGGSFGRLVVVDVVDVPGRRAKGLLVECDCGTRKVVRANNVRSGATRSCGCLEREHREGHWKTHGLARVPEYTVWEGMIARCENPNGHRYADYGGRGITVCARWRADFGAFYADMGPRPSPTHQLDRVDNDRGYEPSNCRWATRHEQQNNMRNSRRVAHGGVTKTVAQWARATGLPYACLSTRLDRGWSVERALTTPVQERGEVARRSRAS
jgi:hypothetical protein